jgi:maltose O-acetyltransferase
MRRTDYSWFPRAVRDGVLHVLRNEIAASPRVPKEHRWRLLRSLGFDVQRSTICPGMLINVPTLHIGRGSFINWFALFEGEAGVSIGDQSLLGPQVIVLTSTHPIVEEYSVSRAGPSFSLPVSIGSGCWIGARVTILPGVTVGDGCVIAAGSVVTTSCEPNGLYAGVPARRKRDLGPRRPL